MIQRRQLLHTAISAGAASLAGCQHASAASQPVKPLPIVDTNIHLFHWPFRRLPLDETDKLVKKLRSLGVAEAWTGSYEALLHRDMASVNDRLANACERHAELIPVGSIHLNLPGWEDDLHRCLHRHKMPAVRLYPNYHGYTLADQRFQQLLKSATKAGCLIQIAAAMEDTRTQHPMMRVADVDLQPLITWMPANPTAKIQILNARPRGTLLQQLSALPGVYFDTARVDGTDSIARLIDAVPPARLMLGSHAPFLIPEAALIRVAESNLNEDKLRSVLAENALAIRSSV